MLKNIIKQVWNQRRMNGWILLELVIAGIFLWTIVDPMYVLGVYHFEPKGYETEGRYTIQLGYYGENSAKRDTTITVDGMRNSFLNIVRTLRDCPEVESVCLTQMNSFPNSGGWNGAQYYADTTKVNNKEYVHTSHYSYLDFEGGNIFQVYGMKDALTGGELVVPADAAVRNLHFVSESFARNMYGTIDVVGKKIYDYRKNAYEIGGVFKDYKHTDFQPSYPLIVKILSDIHTFTYMHYSHLITFKLKEGVDAEAFEEHFMQEKAPYTETGNYYIKGMKSFDRIRQENATENGIYNVIRLKSALAIFTLMCIFLGMVGTFWIRCNARRQEVGLMRSMGASRISIVKRFLTESTLLVTVAYVVSLLFLVHYAMEGNMHTITGNGEPEFAIINPLLNDVPHFCMVSLITYLILLLIALVGTIIPVKRAANVLPADALRDE